MSRLNPSDFIGKIYQTNNSGECFIIDYKSSKDVTVMFYDGYVVKVFKDNLDKGKVRNPYHPNNLTKGVGVYYRTPNHFTKEGIKVRNLWYNMLQRCYCDKFHQRQVSYEDIVVCDSWLTYAVFENDIISMKNFQRFMQDGWELDKDLIKIGSNIYSKDTCCFIPKSLNSKFSQIIKAFEDDVGVYLLPDGKYRVKVRGNGRDHKGCFKTKQEALSSYREHKREILLAELGLYEDEIDSEAVTSVRDYLKSNKLVRVV